MAPAAKIVYVGAPNNYQDLDAAMNHVVDQHLAQIVTNSYGFATELLPPGYVKPFNDTLIQAAAEGIGVYFSSGDTGDETARFGFATTEWPTSSPWVTAVGGTSLGVGQANTRVLETGWGTSDYSCNTTTLACSRTGWLYGAGGGVSRLFPEPSYQSGAGLNLSGRGVPDVAALGDPQTGLLIGQTQTFPEGSHYDEYRIGGTSLSSPIFAGLMALADQKAGHPHGFANPAFYANAGSFYDVLSVKTAVARRNFNNSVDASAGTSDHLRTFDDYSGSPTQHTSPGWDNVTGLGTPQGVFAHYLPNRRDRGGWRLRRPPRSGSGSRHWRQILAPAWIVVTRASERELLHAVARRTDKRQRLRFSQIAAAMMQDFENETVRARCPRRISTFRSDASRPVASVCSDDPQGIVKGEGDA
jgi:subtilase family serine protease